MIYRVIVKTTGSRQPSGTFWNKEVVYCDTSLEDARVAYLKNEALDYGAGHGNRARVTEIEGLKSAPDDIADTTAEEVEA